MIKSRPGAKEPGVESQPSSYSVTLGNLLARSVPVSSTLTSDSRTTSFPSGGFEDSTRL